MSKEYIEREAAKELMEQALADEWEIQYADDRLDETPAADVVEVKYARWKGAGMGDYYCSLCNERFSIYKLFHYCPNCGAKMDGGVNDG